MDIKKKGKIMKRIIIEICLGDIAPQPIKILDNNKVERRVESGKK